MPMFTSPDGRYTFAMETAGSGLDGNSVVYDRDAPDGTPPLGKAVWSRKHYEAGLVAYAPTPPAPVVRPAPSVPSNPAPPTHDGGGTARVIPVTTEHDGPFAPRMMSDRANAWVSGGTAFVFAGSLRTGGPQFFGVDLQTGAVSRFGQSIRYSGETEGWYWTPDGKVMVLDGPRLRRVNPFTPGTDEIVLDISVSHPGCDLWQPHSSDDGKTHSATVRQIVSDGAYPKIATIVATQGKAIPFSTQGTLDESQVTRNGRWVVIKEDSGDGDRNRIINLETRETRVIADRERGIGHSDCGLDILVGEADKPDPGGLGVWDLRQPVTPERFRLLVPSTNMGYVSVRAGRCLWSNDTSLNLVDLQSGRVTHLRDHGGGSGYDDRVKANLSPCGKVACYMVGGSVFLMVLP